MQPRMVSTRAPMTLKERDSLQKINIRFMLPCLGHVFLARGIDVNTKSSLVEFVDRLLLNARDEFPTKNVPKSGNWELEDTQHKLVRLDKWDPYDADEMVYILRPAFLPLHSVSGFPCLQRVILGAGTWGQTSDLMSFQVSPHEILEVRGLSHILIIIRCQVKKRPSKKKIEESRHEFFISLESKISNLVASLQTNDKVGTLFVVPETCNNLKASDNRKVSELGWVHGTELRLEMW